MSLFVDTSAWYAALDRSDVSHLRMREILGDGDPLVTTDHVLVETWLLADARLGRDVANRFWDALEQRVATVEIVVRADLVVALATVAEFAGQTFSLVDCTSFAVMRRLGIHRVATLDNDFAVYRFGPRKRRAFEVLR